MLWRWQVLDAQHDALLREVQRVQRRLNGESLPFDAEGGDAARCVGHESTCCAAHSAEQLHRLGSVKQPC